MKDERLEKICQMVRTLKESPTMSVGAGGYTGSADPEGPVAGYDPVSVSYTHLTLPTICSV